MHCIIQNLNNFRIPIKRYIVSIYEKLESMGKQKTATTTCAKRKAVTQVFNSIMTIWKLLSSWVTSTIVHGFVMSRCKLTICSTVKLSLI